MVDSDNTPRNSGKYPKKFHWKGRYVSESVYNQRVSLSNSAKKRKLTSVETEPELEEQTKFVVEGRRIVDLTILSNYLECKDCKQVLSLKNIENEILYGLASVLKIRCHHCLLLNNVPTDFKNEGDNRQKNYAVNLKATLATLHAGIGYTHLNKLLACMNIPFLSSDQFKRYEKVIGTAIESVAKNSCEESAQLERKLTIENLDSLQAILPDDLPANFLVPTCTQVPEFWSDITIQDEDTVRLMVSYDMGWSKRGAGRNYDSLNGYGAINGSNSKRILDYGTKNRKCRACNRGIASHLHDCRFNFEGSAKAMEPQLAMELCTQSFILKNANTEVGILVGDDDSSTIAAVRKVSDHPVVKLSDKNHASKGVESALYNIKKQHKELTKEAIDYLHRCFTYAIFQNKGNSSVIADVLQQIPDHCFNRHEKCGAWCRFADEENYEHGSIPGGFNSESLHLALIDIFTQLAKNANKFSHGASSQLNENLNAIMASKAPKSRCYSLSASSDFRFSLAVACKNMGAESIGAIMKNAELSPGKYTSRHTRRMETAKNQRRKTIVGTAFKARRNLLKKYRDLLRKKKELTEGTSYQSNMGLFQDHATLAVETANTDTAAIVFCDLETSSLTKTAEILQIGARYCDESFGMYVNPTKLIAPSASVVNGLTNKNGELLLRGMRVASSPLRTVLGALHKFLLAIGRPCVLVAHNCNFDSTRLLRAIEIAGMSQEFISVISGFTDTLPLFKQMLGRNNNCSQTCLASELLQISDEGAHDAVQDVEVLQKLVACLEIPDNLLIDRKKTISDILERQATLQSVNISKKTLAPFVGVISSGIIAKISSAAVDFDLLVDTFTSEGEPGIIATFYKSRRKTASDKFFEGDKYCGRFSP